MNRVLKLSAYFCRVPKKKRLLASLQLVRSRKWIRMFTFGLSQVVQRVKHREQKLGKVLLPKDRELSLQKIQWVVKTIESVDNRSYQKGCKELPEKQYKTPSILLLSRVTGIKDVFQMRQEVVHLLADMGEVTSQLRQQTVLPPFDKPIETQRKEVLYEYQLGIREDYQLEAWRGTRKAIQLLDLVKQFSLFENESWT